MEDGGSSILDDSSFIVHRSSFSESPIQNPKSKIQNPLEVDLIVANIIARVLVVLAHDLAGALCAGGLLITSGIIAEREAEVVAALAATGLAPVERRQEGDWVALVHWKAA